MSTRIEPRRGRGFVELWDCDTWQRGKRLPEVVDLATSIAFAPDGKELAVGDFTGALWLWNLATNTAHSFPRQKGAILSVVFSPDGQRLASAGVDRTVNIWHRSAKRRLLTLPAHPSRINCIAFAPDGQTLVSAGEGLVPLSGVLHIWRGPHDDVQPPKRLEQEREE